MAEDEKVKDPAAPGGVHHVSTKRKAKVSAYADDAFREERAQLRAEVEERKRREKAEAKAEATVKGEKTAASVRFKRWWYGMGKESRRIAWPTPRYLVTSLIIVILVIAVLTAVFFGISQLFVSLGVIRQGT